MRSPSWWRRLPLTAQLAVVGMLVTLAWFLTARLAADRAAELAAQRVELQNRLHAAELAATRLQTDVSTMAAAQRGFVITGDERHGIAYERARRSFFASLSPMRTASISGSSSPALGNSTCPCSSCLPTISGLVPSLNNMRAI